MKVFLCPNCEYEDSSFIPEFGSEIVDCPSCGRKGIKKEDYVVDVPGGNSLTPSEYGDLMKYINQEHRFGLRGGKNIKYIDSTLDFRTGEIFSVTLRGMFEGGKKVFCKVNENRHRSMKKWIYDWLDPVCGFRQYDPTR